MSYAVCEAALPRGSKALQPSVEAGRWDVRIWGGLRMENGALSDVQTAPLVVGSTGSRRGLSGSSISSRLGFTFGVAWLVLLMSGIIPYLAFTYGTTIAYPLAAVFVAGLVVFRMRQLPRIALVPETWLWGLFMLLPVILYFVGGQKDYFADRAMKDRIAITFFLLGSAVLLLGPDSRRLLRVSASIVLAWAIPVCFIEFVGLPLFTTGEGRSAGLYQNPNMASAAILLCMILAVELARPTAKSMIVMALGIGAVFATFSRMGMVFATLLGIGFSLTPRFADRRAITAGRRIVVLATLVVLGAVAVAWVTRNIELSDDAQLRIRSFLTGDLSDASATGRIERAFETAAVARKDLLGHGPGTVERMLLGPHNTYLYIAVDYGIPGVLLFLGILGFGFARAFRAGFRRAAGAMAVVALMAFTSFFDHHVDNSLYLAVGFAALMTGALIDPEKRPVRAPPAAIP